MTKEQARTLIERMPLLEAYAGDQVIQLCWHEGWYDVQTPDFLNRRATFRVKPPAPTPRRITVVFHDGQPCRIFRPIADLMPGEETVVFVEDTETPVAACS